MELTATASLNWRNCQSMFTAFVSAGCKLFTLRIAVRDSRKSDGNLVTTNVDLHNTLGLGTSCDDDDDDDDDVVDCRLYAITQCHRQLASFVIS